MSVFFSLSLSLSFSLALTHSLNRHVYPPPQSATKCILPSLVSPPPSLFMLPLFLLTPPGSPDANANANLSPPTPDSVMNDWGPC